MKYNKDCTFAIGFGTVGSKAGEICDVWKLGFHIFSTQESRTFRICYLKTSHRTYYWQISFHKKELAVKGK